MSANGIDNLYTDFSAPRPERSYEYTLPASGRSVVLCATDNMFSPSGPDRGTRAMLSYAEFAPGAKVLDLGCGNGIVGICALEAGARVTMCDVLPEAVEAARYNLNANFPADIADNAKVLVSDGFDGVADNDFELILSNPPYHTDFSVAKRFIEGSFYHLATGGRLLMVTKRLDWYKNKLTAVFGGVKVRESDGYYVFIAEKRDVRPQNLKKKAEKARRKKEAADNARVRR